MRGKVGIVLRIGCCMDWLTEDIGPGMAVQGFQLLVQTSCGFDRQTMIRFCVILSLSGSTGRSEEIEGMTPAYGFEAGSNIRPYRALKI